MRAPRNPFGDRPDYVNAHIAERFISSSNPHIPYGYRFNGTAATQYSWKYADQTINEGALLSRLGEGNGRNALDIGTGAGRMVLALTANGYKAQGVSLVDYRKLDDPSLDFCRGLTDEQYLVGDAHNLRQLKGVRENYRVVMSHLCLIHLQADPLATLVDAANLVEGRGTLALDGFALPTAYGSRDDNVLPSRTVYDSLQEAGFDPLTKEIETSIDAALKEEPYNMPPLLMRRGNDSTEVRINAFYGHHDEPALYYTSARAA